MHVVPEGEVRVCCVADGRLEGDSQVTGKSNSEIMNVEGLKRIRRQMLANERPTECLRCYAHEDAGRPYNSMRKYFNDEFTNDRTWDLIENQTQTDGTLDKIEIQYLDIRFGNICNFKCRMCGHSLSSTWYDEHMVIDPGYTRKKFIHVDMYEQLEPFFDTVTEIYFAGGEPLLYPEHYKILQELIDRGRTDVHLKYNTNLSNLDYKRVRTEDYWAKFSRVSIGASIDGSGPIIEYMRTGSDWETLKRNFQRVLDNSNALIYVTPTIGSLNVEMLPEFHQHLYELGFIGKPRTLGHTFLTNYVDGPKYQNIKYLPNHYKAILTEKFYKHIEWVQTIPEAVKAGTDKKWLSIIDFLNEPVDNNLLEMRMLQGQLALWDNLNPGKLDWRKQLPHLEKVFH